MNKQHYKQKHLHIASVCKIRAEVKAEYLIRKNAPFDKYPKVLMISIPFANGFGNILYEYLFIKNSKAQRKYWDFMNWKKRCFITFIEKYPLRDEVVLIICEELGKDEWTPYLLSNELERFFSVYPIKLTEFKVIAERIGHNYRYQFKYFIMKINKVNKNTIYMIR